MATQLQLRKGTKIQNDAFTGAEAELTYDSTSKGLRLHDGTQQGGYEVPVLVAVQRPTAENNYTWFRVWSDGWVEQGGAIVGLTDWANRTIDLPITMRDRGYSYVQSPIMNTSTGPGDWAVGVTLKTETQITSRFYANNGYLPTWEVKGMAA